MAISPELREARCRNLVDAAHALIRETGGTGFSMLELARRAGVSPATPYTLLGSKSELLRRVIRDEFESFAVRLAAEPPTTPLAALLRAIDLVVVHYTAEPQFYRGLYLAVLNTQANELRAMMTAEGQLLWSEMVRAAVEAGELERLMPDAEFTGLLLRTMTVTVEEWLAQDWEADQFARNMLLASRLLFLGLVGPDDVSRIRAAMRSAAV